MKRDEIIPYILDIASYFGKPYSFNQAETFYNTLRSLSDDEITEALVYFRTSNEVKSFPTPRDVEMRVKRSRASAQGPQTATVYTLSCMSCMDTGIVSVQDLRAGIKVLMKCSCPKSDNFWKLPKYSPNDAVYKLLPFPVDEFIPSEPGKLQEVTDAWNERIKISEKYFSDI